MEVTFNDQALDELETNAAINAGYADAVVRAYRKTMGHIRAASDERTFYARRSFRFEKLQGDRQGQFSMRLNDQWRLILEIRGSGKSKSVHIVEIVDYH